MLFSHLISRNEAATGLFVQWVTSLIESKTQNFQSLCNVFHILCLQVKAGKFETVVFISRFIILKNSSD